MSKLKSTTIAAGPGETTSGRTPENLGTPTPAESTVAAAATTFEAKPGLFKVLLKTPPRTGEEVARSLGQPPERWLSYSAEPARDVVVRVKASSEDVARDYALSKHPGARVLAVERYAPSRLSPPASSHPDHITNFEEAR